MVLDSFKFSMYIPVTKDRLIISDKGSAIFNSITFKISLGMLCGPVDLFIFRLFIILIIQFLSVEFMKKLYSLLFFK